MPAIAPAFAAISAFVATPVGGLLAGVALNVVGGLISQAMASQPKQNDPGVELIMRVGGDHALSFIVGTSATAGHRIYAGAWGESDGTPNAYFVDVLELGNVPFDSLAGTVVNGERSEVFWNQPHAEFGYPVAFGRRDGKDHLFVKFKDGRQTEADPYLRSRFGAHPQYPYEADMVGRGTPYAIVTVLYHRELWQGSAPTMLFEVRGIRCYDVRKDSTAGGVGAHRRANPATWEWSDNPWVIAYNTAFMGVYHETEWLWGLQNLPAIRLPLSAWVAAMNEADRAITLPGGSGATERQFCIGGEVLCDTQPADFLDQIGASCSGRTIEVGGYYKPQCGAPGSSVFTIDARHLVISEGRSLTPFPGLEATHNTIQVEYTEPAEAYGPKSAPERTKAEFMAADGNRKLVAGVRLPMVQRNTQAQRLGATMLADARQFRQFAGAFHPLLWVVEPGDMISVNLPEEGFVDKKFVVLQMAGRRTFVQSMTFKETDPADFEVPPSIILPYSVGPVQTSYPPAQAVSAWAADGYEHIDSQSRARRAGIKCFYGGALPGIQFIKIMVRRAGEAEPFASALVEYDTSRVDASTILIGDYLLSDQPYEVASTLIPFEARAMAVSDWIAVRTPNVGLAPADLGPELGDFYDVTQEFLDTGLTTITDAIAGLDADFAGVQTQVDANFAQLNSAIGVIEAQVAELTGVGPYDAAKAYQEEQLVTFDGGLYRAIQNVPVGTAPTNAAYWQKIGNYDSLGEAVAVIAAQQLADVTRIDGVLASQSQDITTLGASLTTTNTNVTAAQAAAQAASTLAGSKGKVLVQNGAPAAADRNANTLWIDTTGGANTPKRWVSGTTWAAVTDKVATDAAAAAAAAQATANTKADASAVASLTTRVTEAEGTVTSQGNAITGLSNSLTTTNGNVATAQQAAEAAATLAGSKGKVLVQTAAPAAADRNANTLWIDTTGGANTPKRWTTGTTWVAVTDKVATDAAAAAAAANAAVATKADASTVQTLSNTVTQQGNALTAQGGAITGVQASIADISPSGINLLPDAYSFPTDAVASPIAVSAAAATIVAEPLSLSGFAFRMLSTTATTAPWVCFGLNTVAGRNFELEPGTYIVSAYCSSDNAAQSIRPRLYSTGTPAISAYGASKVVGGTRTRQSWEVVIPANVSGRASLLWYINMHAGPVTDVLLMDSIMIERKATGAASSAPSPFAPGPSSASVAAGAAATTSLTARVANAEGTLTTQANQLTGLATSVAGKADASAVADLGTQITVQGDKIVSSSRDLRKISNALMAGALLGIEQGAGDHIATSDALAASASVSERSRSEVSRIDGVTTALAEVITEIQAAVGDNLAESIKLVQTLATDVSAQATAIDLLRAALGGNSAEVLVKWEAAATPAGYAARYALRVSVVQDGITRQASLFLDVPTDPNGRTRIGLSADDTVFFDSNGNPMALIGGDGVFRSANNAVQINMLTGFFSFGVG